jgi:hypothetical protein
MIITIIIYYTYYYSCTLYDMSMINNERGNYDYEEEEARITSTSTLVLVLVLGSAHGARAACPARRPRVLEGAERAEPAVRPPGV